MTLKQILNEVDIEFGNGQALAITDTLKSNKTTDKSGAKDGLQKKTTDVRNMNSDTRQTVANVVAYLKKKGIFDKVAIKQSFNTSDVVMRADGAATINFDDGGNIVIPASVLGAPIKPEQKAGFAEGLKKIVSVSVDTEEEEMKEGYFPY